MSVCISLGSCFDLKLNRTESLRFLQKYSHLIDGIELLFATPAELMDFELDSTSKNFLDGLDFVSIHMPFIETEYLDNKETRAWIEKAVEIAEKTRAQYLLFHPHRIKSFDSISTSMQVCIENMDAKTPEFAKPEKIKELLEKHKQFGFVFDVCHAIDSKIEPTKFAELKNKMKAMHTSSMWQKNGKIKRHGFLVEADKQQLDKIKQVMKIPVPKIIESDIYPEKVPLLEKEIELIRKLEN